MADALQSILTQAGLAIGPLRSITTPTQAVAFFQKLGYQIPSAAFGSALSTLAAQAEGLVTNVQKLVNTTDESDIVAEIASTLECLVGTVNAISQLHAEIQAGGGGAIPNLSDLPRRLTDFLILDYFDLIRPDVHEMLLVVGLIEYNANPSPTQPMRLVNWDRFGQVFTTPGQIFDDVYKWSTAFDADTFLARLQGLMRSVALPGGMYPQTATTQNILGNVSTNLQELRFPLLQNGLTPQTYSQFGITFSPAEAQGGAKAGIALLPYLMGTSDFQFSVCDQGELVFQSSADIKGVGIVIRPPLDVKGILNLTGAFDMSLSIEQTPAAAQEIIIVGSPGGSRLSVQGLGVKWYLQNPQGQLDLGVDAQLQALHLVINGDEGDGFLQELLSGVNVDAQVSLTFGMSLQTGFTFQAGGQLAIELGTHIDLGPIQIQGLRFVLEPAGDHINLDAGANMSASLGPLQASVENIGITAALSFQQGNLGPADLEVSFMPPDGAGLSIDAAVVSGGGYVSFDSQTGEYTGILQLSILDFVSVTAIGLIDTKMPDGSSGFSLLIIITADFGAGIQLGFGFTLLAVGGLLGLNRSAQMEALAAGVQSNAVASVMFPTDVIANASRIISDLKTFFPPQRGTFLIGPMAKLGWGEPTLVSLSLGIIVEIPPGDIAILGILQIELPAEEAAILVLQVNFIGVFEPDKQRFYFFASLFDSHLLFITIGGQMGVLFAYGDNANFVLSVGGFHPQFNPPPLPFPAPQRIQISIINESFARIQCQGYFAVTTNTVQFGTNSSYYFGFSALSMQGSSSFDALIQFSPFYFTVDMSMSFSVEVFGLGVYGINVDLSLSGPTPWHAHGTASISFLFFSIGIGVDFTWGDSQNTTFPPIAVMPILAAEFEKRSNWRALPPTNSNLLVSLRKLDPSDTGFVLHPVGTLQISQRAAPLDLTLDKYGSQTPSDANRFSLAVGTGALGKIDNLQDQFAPAQFQNMDDADKLSSAAFVPLDSGIELAAAGKAYATGNALTRIVRYDVTIIDKNLLRLTSRFFNFAGSLFQHLLLGSSVARSPLSAYQKSLAQPYAPKVTVQPETFAVAFAANNRVYRAEAANFSSQAAANDYLARAVSTDPSLAGTLHVLPQFELALAA